MQVNAMHDSSAPRANATGSARSALVSGLCVMVLLAHLSSTNIADHGAAPTVDDAATRGGRQGPMAGASAAMPNGPEIASRSVRRGAQRVSGPLETPLHADRAECLPRSGKASEFDFA